MRLTDFLDPELVLFDLRTDGVGPTVRSMATRLAERGHIDIDDVEAVASAVEEREARHSTSLGNGVALPHATVAGLDRPRLLVARAADEIRFGQGEEPVRVFFLLLSPTEQAGAHIKLLARIVRLVRRPGFVSELLDAESPDALLEVVGRLDAIHP